MVYYFQIHEIPEINIDEVGIGVYTIQRWLEKMRGDRSL